MKTFVLAMAWTLTVASIVVADEFPADIVKVEGTTVTYFDMTKKGRSIKQLSANVSNDVKILKAVLKMANVYEAGDPLELGFKNDIFVSMDEVKGIRVIMTTDERTGNITQIWVIQPKAKKNAKKKGAKDGD